VTGLLIDRAGDLVESATAVFSPCRTYRYYLDRIWNLDEAPMVFIMLNPSTADALVLDPTIRRCAGFARREGCGGVIVLNLFALRSTDPKALYGHPDPVGPDNDAAIAETVAMADVTGAPVVGAWGVHGVHLDRAGHVAAGLAATLTTHTQLLTLGVTKDGHPRHPLYVKGDAPLVPYQHAAPTV